MGSIIEALKSVSGYPVSDVVFKRISKARGINLEDEATAEIMLLSNYRLATADITLWVSFAPNVSQEGVSYSMSNAEREEMRKIANAIYRELNDNSYIPESKTKYGYKGDRL
jgi:hypothetical protein